MYGVNNTENCTVIVKCHSSFYASTKKKKTSKCHERYLFTVKLKSSSTRACFRKKFYFTFHSLSFARFHFWNICKKKKKKKDFIRIWKIQFSFLFSFSSMTLSIFYITTNNFFKRVWLNPSDFFFFFFNPLLNDDVVEYYWKNFFFSSHFLRISTPYHEAGNSLLVARPQLEVAAIVIVSLSPYLHLCCRPAC